MPREITNNKIGSKIRSARIARGLSRSQLGNMLGVTFQQVAKYENGSNRISSTRLVTLASLFNMGIEHFLETSGPITETAHGRLYLEIARNIQAIEDDTVLNALSFLTRALKHKD